MIKLLIGGSPCTHWSIAQKGNRETEPSGIGWELFKNYLIAKEKFQPDFFLYENNKSTSQPIKDAISDSLGAPLQYIDSALVSAQRRQRFYVHNIPGVPLPEDRGILLKDVIECGIPLNTTVDGKAQCLRACCYKDGIRNMVANEVDRRTCVAVPIRQTSDGKSRALTASYGKYAASDSIKEINARTGVVESYVGQKGTVYTVSGGIITIKNKQYPIKLPDGDYIIRKLSIPECKRLQTVPDDYIMPCSATQNYKMLGNGWTVDVIAHILSHVPNIRNEKVVVLSMYDGMACGHIALNRLGANVVRYFAFEIDKDAIETATTNFPDIIQCGDAFRMRDIQFGQRAA